MKKILIIIPLSWLLLFPTDNFEKLSKDDKKKCMEVGDKIKAIWDDEDMVKIRKEVSDVNEVVPIMTTRESYREEIEKKSTIGETLTNKQKNKNFQVKEIYIYATNNLMHPFFDSIFILIEEMDNYKFKMLGVTGLFRDSHSKNFASSSKRYNNGFLINVTDYARLSKVEDKFFWGGVFPDGEEVNDLHDVVLLKEKPNADISYIKINNCYVESYYSKNKKTKFKKNYKE